MPYVAFLSSRRVPAGPSLACTWQRWNPAHLPGHTAEPNDPELEIRHQEDEVTDKASAEDPTGGGLFSYEVSHGRPFSPAAMPVFEGCFTIRREHGYVRRQPAEPWRHTAAAGARKPKKKESDGWGATGHEHGYPISADVVLEDEARSSTATNRNETF